MSSLQGLSEIQKSENTIRYNDIYMFMNNGYVLLITYYNLEKYHFILVILTWSIRWSSTRPSQF